MESAWAPPPCYRGVANPLEIRHSLRTVIVNHYTSYDMVGICVLIDISKAYDRTNYIGSFTKLMDQLLPANVLSVIEDCFHESFTCVIVSHFPPDSGHSTRRCSIVTLICKLCRLNVILATVERTRYGCCSRSACAS